MKYKKIAFVFPGQGSQYVGMAADFVREFSIAKETFEEADEILKRKLSSIILQGPEQLLTETKNSQTGIFVASIAILRTVQMLFPQLNPFVCAGLSLGEYTALTAAGKMDFANCLSLVQYRGQYMNDACEATKGTMAVILGLEAEAAERMVKEVNLPNDLWAANFNCPGQVVISGTLKGVEEGMRVAKEKGAKRALPLQVHGAFHSGLMRQAEERLKDHINQAVMRESLTQLVMNVPGNFVTDEQQMRHYLIKQVVSPVRWEQGVRSMTQSGVDLFIEMGCGKTLTGMNKKIEPTLASLSVEKVEDLKALEAIF